MPRRLVLSGLFATACLTGCSSDPDPRPLGTDQFYRRDDRGGAITPGPRVTPGPTDNEVPPVVSPNGVPTREIPVITPPSKAAIDITTDQVKTVTPTTLSADAGNAPKSTPVTYEVGQYISIGAIIAEVNGTPVYADDVVRSVAPILAAQAKDLDESGFRKLSTTEINRQVNDMIGAEVAYAAADRNTTSEDKRIAEARTQMWRDKLKTESKGSMEEVRKRFREQGQTYDEVAKEEYRRNLVRVFYAKKLLPRVQVTADDMRRYYDRYRDNQFTQHETLTFRLIKITAQAMGSDALARKKVDELAVRANRGEDFATIAGEVNHDPSLLRNKGLTGPIDKGAFRLEKVEAALLAVNPGDTTPVVEEGGAYYLAHLEGRTKGRVAPFEENDVQRQVYDTLQKEQLANMRREFEGRLVKDAVVAKNDSIFSTAVSMAMQNYPKWHRQ